MNERQGRGRVDPIPPVRDPAKAIAMAKCWLSTWVRRAGPVGMPDVGTFHPQQCGYCEVPRDMVIQALEEFQSWSKISTDTPDGAPLHLEIEAWETIPESEQVRRVRLAQGYIQPDRGLSQEDRRSPW